MNGRDRRDRSRGSGFDRAAIWWVLKRPSVLAIALSYTAYGYLQHLFFYWLGVLLREDPAPERRRSRVVIRLGSRWRWGPACFVEGGWRIACRVTSLLGRARAACRCSGCLPAGIVFEDRALAISPQTTLAALLCRPRTWLMRGVILDDGG